MLELEGFFSNHVLKTLILQLRKQKLRENRWFVHVLQRSWWHSKDLKAQALGFCSFTTSHSFMESNPLSQVLGVKNLISFLLLKSLSEIQLHFSVFFFFILIFTPTKFTYAGWKQKGSCLNKYKLWISIQKDKHSHKNQKITFEQMLTQLFICSRALCVQRQSMCTQRASYFLIVAYDNI